MTEMGPNHKCVVHCARQCSKLSLSVTLVASICGGITQQGLGVL